MRTNLIFAVVGFFILPNVIGRKSHRSLDQTLYKHRRLSPRHNNATDYQDNGTPELVKRGETKYVFMHHIVGNTFPYTQADWADDIRQIQAKGVDALALNMGGDSWQRTQISSAYAAAADLGTNFKLFISFDFTAMGCDVNDIVNRVNQFASHPNQLQIDGRPMISSFAGSCLGNAGWASLKAQTNGYLMPFIEGIEGQFGSWTSLDSWYCWGCAWPQGNMDKNTGDDDYYISQLGSRYGATVSNWMFTHYDYKNWYQRGDDWLIITRWEQLMAMRNTITFAEMISWNDYGESHYFGPIKGAQPDRTTWVNNIPHTAWFDMSQYYITAFKTGSYPLITQDVIYYWARPHPATATASSDPLSHPTGFDWSPDVLWAVVFSTSPSTVTLSCGSSSQTFDNVAAGVTKLKIPLAPGKITVTMIKNGATVINQTPSDYTFATNPSLYNYNAYVGSAKGISTPPTSTTATSSTSVSTTTTTTSTSGIPPAPTTTSISGVVWSYLGCYPDFPPRTLNNGINNSIPNQSVATCLNMCSSANYSFGGTEFGVECWCSNAITAGINLVSANECNMSCSGNSSDTCGAGNRISLYSAIGVKPSTTPSPTSPSSTAPTPTLVPAPAGSAYSYYGCVAEGTFGSRRALTGPSFSQNNMTPQTCQSLCTGYQFAGVEYGLQCFCGNSLRNNGATGAVIDSDSCGVPCAGDPSKKCGGSWTLSVYSKGSTGNTLPPPPPPSGWTSAGCFIDTSDRILRASMTTEPGMTTERCVAICSSQGHSIAATEHGSECMCDSKLFTTGGIRPINDSDCNMKCDGNPAQMCGSTWRANVYVRSSTLLPGIKLQLGL
ncbi:glycosyl hydrolase family 71-domain-containing protein [Collybia nuda]|uniref:Glycosyl hydrolase family 71-domain-containing protein n=1 Tax=Collybia nuda TaxID=64659 RepID=A0A9P6CD22_9AGAR|nr:glycosyl hydrolase family 71-domain-containing protein [Collybia nuda]